MDPKREFRRQVDVTVGQWRMGDMRGRWCV